MFDSNVWKEIFQSISKNKIRSVLSGLTILFAIFIFTVLFGVSNGLKNTFQSFFLDDAINTFFIRSGKTSKPYKGHQIGRRIQMKNEDHAFIKNRYGDKVEYITSRIYKSFVMSYGKNRGNFRVRAVNPDHQYIERTLITEGRYINEMDIENFERVVVIGRLVEEDLFKKTKALGKYIRISSLYYKVVGVFSDKGGDNEERIVYMPITTAQKMYSNNEYVDQINMTYNPSMNFFQAKTFANTLLDNLKRRFDVSPKDQRAIRLYNSAEDKAEVDGLLLAIGVIIFFIGIGSLFAGVAGISNIMTYIVKERTKELGIRKALGATPKSIIGLILLESVFVTSISGYIGILVAMGTIGLIGNSLERFFIKDPHVEFSLILTATIILIIAGLLAGYLPARRAARIKPVVALRND